MPALQQRYYDVLLERVRNDRFPSGQLLDRLEGTIYTPEQVIEYVDVLIQKGFGSGKLPAAEGKFEVMQFGTIQSPRMQSIFYSACDTFVVPSRIESFGLTALEAMACSTPVVAFRTGGLAQLVVHEKTGLLADLATGAPSLFEALSWMSSYPIERQNMGNAARRRVEQELDRWFPLWGTPI